MAQRKQLNWSTISDDNLSGSNKRSSISGQETRYSVSIPVDVIINILSRLPLKSIAQCRCVCKLWSSIARRPNYNLLFPIKSPDETPRILFAFKVGSNLFFYSSPQHHQNPDNNNNSAIVATRHDINLGSDLQQLCRPVRGLVCSQHIGKNCSWAVISNPITGEIVTTPKLTIQGIHLKERVRGKADYCFGYDPIDKQFKDATKHTWSKRIYISPHASLNWDNYVRPAGMIGSGEILLYRMYTHNPFNIFYYNLEKKIIRRVTFEVPVLEKFDHFGAFTFANYVEDVKLM
ncbi:BnaC01g27990D [Brassica napus]|uniref:BnaC01g27990D protein n=3 Tax=Brassica TaxID=3705 RepID=A0A078HPI6_BRANA|nr:hypothetical protein DY000_02041094 [Brassica cretica]KAF3603935.1 hypothetical protein F2Q69_00036527 [Brassica cretica]CDY38698.1 BnaC01g27990D [Brassica napus]